MIKPEGLIHKLYTSFQIKDWKAMQSCYHDEATFTDPVFQNLTAKEVKAMWHMLAGTARDLKVLFSGVNVSLNKGACQWQAWYKFSRSGRSVHNVITARFEFKDELISRHTDQFDFWRWSRMALGIPGILLGWSPPFRNKIRKTAQRNLAKFISDHP